MSYKIYIYNFFLQYAYILWYNNINKYKHKTLVDSPKLVWTYEFDETSIENVMADVLVLNNWENELSNEVIQGLCDAFASSIIWKLPNWFCVRRVEEFGSEVELYTFYK